MSDTLTVVILPYIINFLKVWKMYDIRLPLHFRRKCDSHCPCLHHPVCNRDAKLLGCSARRLGTDSCTHYHLCTPRKTAGPWMESGEHPGAFILDFHGGKANNNTDSLLFLPIACFLDTCFQFLVPRIQRKPSATESAKGTRSTC